MIEVLSNLLGETVEVTSAPSYPDYSTFVIGRGPVRAVYSSGQQLIVLIEMMLDAKPTGVLRTFDLNYNPVRVVKLCNHCGLWDHPSQLNGFDEHRACTEARQKGSR